MNKVQLLRNIKFISRKFYPRKYYSCSINKPNFIHSKWNVTISSFLDKSKNFKYISSYNSVQKEESDTQNDKTSSEKIQKVLEDEEFQNILKDFANDFGVDKETSHLLEDIRKNINGDYKENKISTDKNNSNYTASAALGGGFGDKFKEFSDSDATVIPSYEDTSENEEQLYHIDQELEREVLTNIKRASLGVFDIDTLVPVLRHENLLDIAVISMLTQDHHCSCEHFVLVTAKSPRHLEAVTESILKLYKKIKGKSDPYVTVEGKIDSGWKVIDMGNIVLHIFLEEVRSKYDVESCQLFDLEYDSGGSMEPDPMLDVIAQQMKFFNELKLSDSKEMPKDIS